MCSFIVNFLIVLYTVLDISLKISKEKLKGIPNLSDSLERMSHFTQDERMYRLTE